MKTNSKTLAAELRDHASYTLQGKSYNLANQAADRLEQHGDPTDAADPNGSTCARLKWWKDRADDLHDELDAEMSLADRLANALVESMERLGVCAGHLKVLEQWKEARRDP
jgi:hypothetical protein